MKYIAFGSIALIGIVLLYTYLHPQPYMDDFPVRTCQESSTVKEILSLEYRDATILLTNGQTISVNQAVLKPGDSICIKWFKDSIQ